MSERRVTPERFKAALMALHNAKTRVIGMGLEAANPAELVYLVQEYLEDALHDLQLERAETERLREALQEGLSLMMIAADTLWRMHDGKALDIAPKAVASDLHNFRRHVRKEFGIRTYGEVLVEDRLLQEAQAALEEPAP